MTPWARVDEWLREPVPLVRLAVLRVTAPLAILGFMAGRIAHADEWLGDTGFHVPDLGGDWRQPLYVPPLSTSAAWGLVTLMVVSGLVCAAGLRVRLSGLTFAATLVFVALADRLAAFTVTKLSPAVMVALALGPSGERLGVDAWMRSRRGAQPIRAERPLLSLRFLQLLPIVIYSASGIAKARGDWLAVPDVLFTQLHGSYQTYVAYVFASRLPAWSWTVLQGLVLAFEAGAPLWFGLPFTRQAALVFGVVMHVIIGAMFGPVVWFALLMIALLASTWAPMSWLAPAVSVAEAIERRLGTQATSR